MKMCEHSMLLDLSETASADPMSSAEVSPAKMSASLEQVPVLKASAAGSGVNTRVSFANYDPATSSWKTSQHSLDGGLTEFSGNWPRSGMMRSGTAFRLPPSAPRTTETASGLLPTPAAREWKDRSSVEILSKLDRGDGVAKRIARIGLQSGVLDPQTIVGLNPRFGELMMGYPVSWTDCEPSETV